jgi:hypothetical protein
VPAQAAHQRVAERAVGTSEGTTAANPLNGAMKEENNRYLQCVGFIRMRKVVQAFAMISALI